MQTNKHTNLSTSSISILNYTKIIKLKKKKKITRDTLDKPSFIFSVCSLKKLKLIILFGYCSCNEIATQCNRSTITTTKIKLEHKRMQI